MRNRQSRRRGQGMTEYIIIVALVAIAAIGVVTIFGDNIRDLFAGATNALAGESSVSVESETSRSTHTETKNLKNFGSSLHGSSN